MADVAQERIDAHLDEWDNLTEQERQYINDTAALRERERAAIRRCFAIMRKRAAAVDAEADAIMTERGW